MFQTLLFRVYLFFAGIKFFETSAMPQSAVLMSLGTRTIEDQEIVFSLYKENCVNFEYRYGRIRRKSFTGYVVKCDVPSVGAPIFRCSRFSLLFKSSYLEKVSDMKVPRLLVQLYMQELRARMIAEQA